MSYSHVGALPSSSLIVPTPAQPSAPRAGIRAQTAPRLASRVPARVRSTSPAGARVGSPAQSQASKAKTRMTALAVAQRRLEKKVRDLTATVLVAMQKITGDKAALAAAKAAAAQATQRVSAEQKTVDALTSALDHLVRGATNQDSRHARSAVATAEQALQRGKNHLYQARAKAMDAAKTVVRKSTALAIDTRKLADLQKELQDSMTALAAAKANTRQAVATVQALPLPATTLPGTSSGAQNTAAATAEQAAITAETTAAADIIATTTQTEQQVADVLNAVEEATTVAQDAVADAKTQVTEVAQTAAATSEEAAAIIKEADNAKVAVGGFKLSLPMVAAGVGLLLLLRR